MLLNCCQRVAAGACFNCMTDKLHNLLILFALALCVLIAFQWHREAKSVRMVQSLTDTLHGRDEAIQSLNGTLKQHEAEILRLDALKNQLNDSLKTNKALMGKLTADLQKSDLEGERLGKEVEAYKEALDKANASIKQQNENMASQNEEMKKLAADRNEVVLKLNKVTEEYNNLVKKWNELVEQVGKGNPRPPTE